MGWRTVVVNSHSKLSYKNNHLIFKDAYRTELIHLSEIDILLLETTDIVISTMLIKRLMDENILVIFCDDKRLPIAQMMPYAARHDSSLQLSRQIAWSQEVKGQVWTQIISQKIRNQAYLLAEKNFVEPSKRLLEFRQEVQLFDPSNREGHAARTYFNTLFGNDFSREKDCPVNAGLDYGYSLLLSMFAREIVVCGCMTQLGLKHTNQFNTFNLASDIMEPFRPIIDRIVYEHRNQEFVQIKRQLFTIFSDTFLYRCKEMSLTNIVSDYTKRVIKALNQCEGQIPEFEL